MRKPQVGPAEWGACAWPAGRELASGPPPAPPAAPSPCRHLRRRSERERSHGRSHHAGPAPALAAPGRHRERGTGERGLERCARLALEIGAWGGGLRWGMEQSGPETTLGQRMSLELEDA